MANKYNNDFSISEEGPKQDLLAILSCDSEARSRDKINGRRGKKFRKNGGRITWFRGRGKDNGGCDDWRAENCRGMGKGGGRGLGSRRRDNRGGSWWVERGRVVFRWRIEVW